MTYPRSPPPPPPDLFTHERRRALRGSENESGRPVKVAGGVVIHSTGKQRVSF